MIHNLQSYPEFFAPTLAGIKTHEVRQHSDHLAVPAPVLTAPGAPPPPVQTSETNPFAVGDVLVLQEFDPKTGVYSGRQCTVTVTWINDLTPKPWLDPDWTEMSIRLERP